MILKNLNLQIESSQEVTKFTLDVTYFQFIGFVSMCIFVLNNQRVHENNSPSR